MKRVRHQGQRPARWMRAAWRSFRTRGRLGRGGRFFSRASAAASSALFLPKKREGCCHQGHVVVPAPPAAAFKVIKPKLLLEFPVVLLDAPARFC